MTEAKEFSLFDNSSKKLSVVSLSKVDEQFQFDSEMLKMQSDLLNSWDSCTQIVVVMKDVS